MPRDFITLKPEAMKKLEFSVLRNALQTILDHADYTAGACKPNDMVAAVLPVDIIENAKRLLADTKEHE